METIASITKKFFFELYGKRICLDEINEEYMGNRPEILYISDVETKRLFNIDIDNLFLVARAREYYRWKIIDNVTANLDVIDQVKFDYLTSHIRHVVLKELNEFIRKELNGSTR